MTFCYNLPIFKKLVYNIHIGLESSIQCTVTSLAIGWNLGMAMQARTSVADLSSRSTLCQGWRRSLLPTASTRKPRWVKLARTSWKSSGTDSGRERCRIVSGAPLTSTRKCRAWRDGKRRTITLIRCSSEEKVNCLIIPSWTPQSSPPSTPLPSLSDGSESSPEVSIWSMPSWWGGWAMVSCKVSYLLVSCPGSSRTCTKQDQQHIQQKSQHNYHHRVNIIHTHTVIREIFLVKFFCSCWRLWQFNTQKISIHIHVHVVHNRKQVKLLETTIIFQHKRFTHK